jgi:hypothetical protein
MKPTTCANQPAWTLAQNQARCSLTVRGGHLAPVEFLLRGQPVRPLSIAPWSAEPPDPQLPRMLQVLRGDFFCAPFGRNSRPYRGEVHPPHGETANADWTFEAVSAEGPRQTLHVRLQTTVRPGRVDKRVSVVAGQCAIYQQHVLRGFHGPLSLGHHPMLKFDDATGPGLLSTGALRFGQVYPGAFEDPAQGGYTSLRPGARFRSLARVPLAAGGSADLTSYPAREGFEDLVMVAQRPRGPFAWFAVAYPKNRYVWFVLKDPGVLPCTVLWHSNGGRHYPPWNGRHRGVIGIEDVCGHFHDGLPRSAAPNEVARAGIPTCHRLRPDRPLVVNHVMAMAAVPAGFGAVATIDPAGPGQVRLRGSQGGSTTIELDWEFIGRAT